MYKYKLLKKYNPQDADAPRKWYATSIGEIALPVKEMTREATRNTTMSPIEMEAGLEFFFGYAIQELQHGSMVRIGNLGTLRITFRSEGVADISDFNASTMIKNPRIVFTPSRDFRESVIKGLRFQNTGVIDEGISYASVADYKRAKGIDSGSSSSPEGGEAKV